ARLAARPVADDAAVQRERRGPGGTPRVLLVPGARERRLHRGVEPRQRVAVFAAQIEVEPRFLRDRVEPRPATQPYHRTRGPWLGRERQLGEPLHRAPHGGGGIRHTERRPRMAAGPAIGDAIAARPQSPMYDAV